MADSPTTFPQLTQRSAGRTRWAITIAALVLSAVTARLGVWQLDRADQKNALAAQLRDKKELLPSTNIDVVAIKTEVFAKDAFHRSAKITGTWLPEHTVFLENRQMNAQPGFYVITPLRLDANTVIAVQRGWVPRHLKDRAAVPDVRVPAGEQTVVGRLAPPPAKLYDMGNAGQGRIRQNLDLIAYAAQTNLPVLQHVSLVQTENADPDGLKRDWFVPQTTVAKHHGYAFQWFALTALTFFMMLWWVWIRPRFNKALQAASNTSH
jgi:surfeit locus 1 family protein